MVAAYREKLSVQESYGARYFYKWKWRRLKLLIAEKTGRFQGDKTRATLMNLLR
jgi:hypothetical protein